MILAGLLRRDLALWVSFHLRFCRSRLFLSLKFVSFLLLTSIGTPARTTRSNSVNADPQDQASQIVERSVENLKKDWAAEPDFDCSERNKGKNGTKTYQDIMLYGSQYQKLVGVEGKPLGAREQAEQEQKFQAAISRRQAESDAQRRDRIAKYEAERKHATELILELGKAFSFTMAGTEKIGDHDVYVLNAEPRKGYKPSSMSTRALTGMHGKLWIERASLQWVKVEVEVFHPVSISGFIARVEPGTRFQLEQASVSGGIWLPSHFAVKSHSKVMLVFNRDTDEDETYFDYHPSKKYESAAGKSQSQHHN